MTGSGQEAQQGPAANNGAGKATAQGGERKVQTFTSMLGEVTWLLSQSPLHRNLKLADLEWLVMPALILQQVRIFYQGAQPVGVAFWAYLNEEAEERLAKDGDGELVINFAGEDMFAANYVGGPGAPENTLGIYLANIDFEFKRVGETVSLKASPLSDITNAQLKAGGMRPADDPLALDLDGDGLEFTAEGVSDTWFDLDGDLFAERTGWLRPDDGFLARDLNGNGTIDDIAELFGGPPQFPYSRNCHAHTGNLALH